MLAKCRRIREAHIGIGIGSTGDEQWTFNPRTWVRFPPDPHLDGFLSGQKELDAIEGMIILIRCHTRIKISIINT